MRQTNQTKRLPSCGYRSLCATEKERTWAKIAGFTWFENAKKIGGHAVVFYQPTADSNIWMYDKSGSYETHTKSHELDEIIGALNASLGGSTIQD